MMWVYWTVLGILAGFVVLFFVSCAWLNQFIDTHYDDTDDDEWWPR